MFCYYLIHKKNSLEKLVDILILLGVVFVIGILCQRQGYKWQQPLSVLASRVALTLCIPLSMLSAIWQMPAFNQQLLLLPIVGVAVILTGTIIGLFLVKIEKLKPLEKGALVPVATFYNIGALGSLCIFSLFGENGLALLGLFKLLEEVIYFAWALPYARANSNVKQMVKKYTLPDPFISFSILALVSGLLLNIYGVERPELFISLSDLLVPSGSLLMVLGLGLSIDLNTNMYWRSLAIKMAVLRTLLAPLVGIGVALLLGFNFQEYPLVFKVIVVLAMMPSGFISLLPPVLYGVDRHVASTAWLFSTLVFIGLVFCLLIFDFLHQ